MCVCVGCSLSSASILQLAGLKIRKRTASRNGDGVEIGKQFEWTVSVLPIRDDLLSLLQNYKHVRANAKARSCGDAVCALPSQRNTMASKQSVPSC